MVKRSRVWLPGTLWATGLPPWCSTTPGLPESLLFSVQRPPWSDRADTGPEVSANTVQTTHLTWHVGRSYNTATRGLRMSPSLWTGPMVTALESTELSGADTTSAHAALRERVTAVTSQVRKERSEAGSKLQPSKSEKGKQAKPKDSKDNKEQNSVRQNRWWQSKVPPHRRRDDCGRENAGRKILRGCLSIHTDGIGRCPHGRALHSAEPRRRSPMPHVASSNLQTGKEALYTPAVRDGEWGSTRGLVTLVQGRRGPGVVGLIPLGCALGAKGLCFCHFLHRSQVSL